MTNNNDMDIRPMTLRQLNGLLRTVIESGLPGEYWVEAELSEARESRGHCYMELIEKDGNGNTPTARAQAKCWQSTWSLLRPYFERTTGQQLRPGMKVMLKVYANYHEAYGFSWIVTDIDPTYTIGDMAQKRRMIIEKLKAAGVFDLNKELTLPIFTQRIAIISSETAAGYGDFRNQLADNEYGFAFATTLFPAVMQGERVEESIIAALDRINEQADEYDCVVIIRGGGATSDMSGFDSLALAENIANFPLPVITGIGHDRDESVTDLVAHTSVKTPTAAAAMLIGLLKATADRIDNCRERIARATGNRMETEKMRIDRLAERIPALFSVAKTRKETALDMLWMRMCSATQRRLTAENHRITMLEQQSKALDPALPLKRGYSITLHNGHAVKDIDTLKPGDEIETRVEKGTINAVVKTVSSKN